MKRLIVYLWPFQSYRDVNCGSMMECAAARRHNCRLAIGLPTYINRWAMMAAILLILTQVAPVPLAQPLGVLFTIAFIGFLHMVHVWTMFKRLS